MSIASRFAVSMVCAIAITCAIECRAAPRGDWGATCTRDNECRSGLHCSAQVTNAKGHYCTTVCSVTVNGDDCASHGAPAGWDCWPILDARDGECRNAR